MTDIKENHLQFEAKKLSMTHTKRDGHVLRLAINPVDSPDELFRDEVDQRYLVVMVKLASETDDIVPINPEGTRALNLFGVLVKNTDFQEYLYTNGYAGSMSVEEATSTLKEMIGIQSRQELKSSEQKRRKLFAVRDEFAYNVRAK